MNTQELLVHDGSQRQAVEGIQAEFVNFFRVFVLACEFRGIS
jgi:hypothetical protein